jgi:hypothetical protein
MIQDDQLAVDLCQNRAVFTIPYPGSDIHVVECLLPLRRVISPFQYREELVIARPAMDATAPLTVLQMALIRESLLGARSETLTAACKLVDGATDPRGKYHIIHMQTTLLNTTRSPRAIVHIHAYTCKYGL